MVEQIAERENVLAGRVYANTGVAITPAPSQGSFRCNLRTSTKSINALSKLLSIDLPKQPKTSNIAGTRIALWLGPDEWLIIDSKNDPNADLANSKILHSAVDISHRNTAIMVSGAAAADVINAGCPQDLSLSSFPVGACSRSVLGKSEIVLLRVKPTVFRVEVWRSFSVYAFEFLSTAANDTI